MKRRLFNLAAAVSAVLFVATVALSVRSYRYADSAQWGNPRQVSVRSAAGRFSISLTDWRSDNSPRNGRLRVEVEDVREQERSRKEFADWLVQQGLGARPPIREVGVTRYVPFLGITIESGRPVGSVVWSSGPTVRPSVTQPSVANLPAPVSSPAAPYWSIRMPYHVAAFALFTSAALSRASYLLLKRRAVRRSRRGHCPTCGYDLRATPQGGRCPECATVPDVKVKAT